MYFVLTGKSCERSSMRCQIDPDKEKYTALDVRSIIKISPSWWMAVAVEVAKQFPDVGRYNLNAVYVFSDWDWPISTQLLCSMALNVCSSLLAMVYCSQMFTYLSSPVCNCTDLYANRDSYRRWGLSKPALVALVRSRSRGVAVGLLLLFPPFSICSSLSDLLHFSGHLLQHKQ